MAENKPGGLNELRSGVYTVTKVYCTQSECLDIKGCHDEEGVLGEIGLQDDDVGCYMICHAYRVVGKEPCDMKVYWRRKVPK
jgi:hypothetical protein